jgi:hypothetical protein
MNPNERHDILGELFRGEQGKTVSGLEELDALMKVCLAPKTAPVSGKKLLPLKRKHPDSKKKTTHYLHEDVCEGLTQAKQILKRLLPDGAKGRASKSNLVNYAVNKLLQEIEEKGVEHSVVKTILGNSK